MTFHATGLATLGRDATMGDHDGTAYARLSLAFTYGRKKDGKWPTQWVEATLWGKQASALEPYLKKGSQVSVMLEDAHIEEYTTADGEKRAKLAARVAAIQLTRRTESSEAPPPPPPPPPAPRAPTGFDDMDDDIPF